MNPLIQAMIILCRCEVDCEKFDRTLPGAFHPRAPDEWLPRGDVRHLSNAYARSRRDAARLELDRAGIDLPTRDRALREVRRMRHAAQEAWSRMGARVFTSP